MRFSLGFTRTLAIAAAVAVGAGCSGPGRSALPGGSDGVRGASVLTKTVSGSFQAVFAAPATAQTKQQLGIASWTFFLLSDARTVSVIGSDATGHVVWQMWTTATSMWTSTGFSSAKNADGSATIYNKGRIGYEQTVATNLRTDVDLALGYGGADPTSPGGPYPASTTRHAMSTANKAAAVLAVVAAFFTIVSLSALAVGAAPWLIVGAGLIGAYAALASGIAWMIDAFSPPSGYGGGEPFTGPGAPSAGTRVQCYDTYYYGEPSTTCTFTYAI